MHARPLGHGAPSARRGAQLAPSHQDSVAQLRSLVQLVPQREPSQTKGAHGCGSGGGHEAEAPVHVADSATPPTHAAGAQLTPASTSESTGQLLELPLHCSSVSQTPALDLQTIPARAGLQTPSAEAPRAAVHTSQALVQAVLQHTPSMQKPLAHEDPVVHPTPGPSASR